MQWVQFHLQNAELEGERVDQLARGFVLSGSVLCVFVAAAVWLSTLAG